VVDTIHPCEQAALLPGWVHIRFCDCGVDNDDATATKDSAVKIKTTIIIIIIAVRALIIAMLFIHISNDMSVYLAWVS
jgi:hypothetical protein